MTHIGNHRWVVRGEREDDGRRWAIFATDDYAEANRVLNEGRVVDGRQWRGTVLHDRRHSLMPQGGWAA